MTMRKVQWLLLCHSCQRKWWYQQSSWQWLRFHLLLGLRVGYNFSIYCLACDFLAFCSYASDIRIHLAPHQPEHICTRHSLTSGHIGRWWLKPYCWYLRTMLAFFCFPSSSYVYMIACICGSLTATWRNQPPGYQDFAGQVVLDQSMST